MMWKITGICLLICGCERIMLSGKEWSSRANGEGQGKESVLTCDHKCHCLSIPGLRTQKVCEFYCSTSTVLSCFQLFF